jgi:hypothetical protein
MRLNALEGVLEAVDAETEAERIEIRYDLGGEEYEVEGTPAGAPDSSRKRRSRRRPDRLLVMLVLLIFALAPFATEELHLAEDTLAGLDDDVLAGLDDDARAELLDDDARPLGIAINELGAAPDNARKPVLVSIDYGPATAHELDPLLEAVLWDIFVHDGRVVVTGTNPLGLLHASHILESLESDEALLGIVAPERLVEPEPPNSFWDAARDRIELPPAIDYVILRYLPAGAVGVRSLVTRRCKSGRSGTN